MIGNGIGLPMIQQLLCQCPKAPGGEKNCEGFKGLPQISAYLPVNRILA
jgi:hypothetical protein